MWTIQPHLRSLQRELAGSNYKIIANTVAQWSSENRVKLNSDKCKGLRISFSKKQSTTRAHFVDNKELECVDSSKLLGVTISNNLTWNELYPCFAHVLKERSRTRRETGPSYYLPRTVLHGCLRTIERCIY